MNTTIEDLINVLGRENRDSEILVFSIVVKDSLSGELTAYFPGLNGEIYRK